MDTHRRLVEHLEARRLELRLTWTDLARDSGVTTQTLRQIRAGQAAMRPLTKVALEDALGWARGSIDATLRGGEPTTVHRRQSINGHEVTLGTDETAQEEALRAAADTPEREPTLHELRARLDAAAREIGHAKAVLRSIVGGGLVRDGETSPDHGDGEP
jgi:transcriptional regulator with XRE-family HTH domain